jgi:hypothetical protein
MAKEKNITTLYQNYLDNKLSKEEFEDFLCLLQNPDEEKILADLVDNTWETMFEIPSAPVMPLYKRKWYQASAAAAIFFAVIAGSYFMITNPANKNVSTFSSQHMANQKVEPEGKNVILTLGDGSQIILDDAKNGTLAQQSNAQIIKLDNNQLTYKSTTALVGKAVYNTISTPNGVQYKLMLEDGSTVWLNALSTLHFPASFTGEERVVELEGEGYFEIAKNAERPFIVNIKKAFQKDSDLKVKVLGTHFNINAYHNEPIVKTTLMEGSIEIMKGTTIKRMTPGQQASISEQKGEPGLNLVHVDVEDAAAWKDGRFIFHGNNIQSVMRELSRWYNVTIKYEGEIPNEQFVGKISRSRYEKIGQILAILERTKVVHFQVDGNNIIVMPYKNN